MNDHDHDHDHHRRGGRRRGGPPFLRDDLDQRGRGRRRGGPGGRMRRGDVRNALLIALLDGPAHGYELIQALEAKTEGRWRPSPGSVYPSLQLLADEGLVTATDDHGKRIFAITDAGRAEAQERVTNDGYPWDAMDGDRGDHAALRSAVRDVHIAAKQVGITGSGELVERATAILVDARKELYRLLADA
jgi:DNA-binding PadR family transcriptional regulator